MGNWDDLDAELSGVNLGHEAGQWAVTAMACVAFADGSADQSELDKAKELISKVSVIKNSLGPRAGEQLFLETIERLRASTEGARAEITAELGELSSLITSQEHRDHAFHTLVAIATADHEIQPSEYRLMKELQELIGSTVMVPLPHISVT